MKATEVSKFSYNAFSDIFKNMIHVYGDNFKIPNLYNVKYERKWLC